MLDIITLCLTQRGGGGGVGGLGGCESLTDNVLIRGICSPSVSELPPCSSDPYDTSSGSLQLISIKPVAAQTNYSCGASFERSQDSAAVVNGEVTHTPHPAAVHSEPRGLTRACVHFLLCMRDNN